MLEKNSDGSSDEWRQNSVFNKNTVRNTLTGFPSLQSGASLAGTWLQILNRVGIPTGCHCCLSKDYLVKQSFEVLSWIGVEFWFSASVDMVVEFYFLSLLLWWITLIFTYWASLGNLWINPIWSWHILFFFNVYLFLRERQRETGRAGEGQR